MMGLFSSHAVFFHLSPTLLLTRERGGTMRACSLGGAAFLPVVWGILPELYHSFWKVSDCLEVFQDHNNPKHIPNGGEIIFEEKNS